MTSSLALQLSRIATKSSNSLNLKAQRIAHSKSLLFEPEVAANQDFDHVFAICNDGFQELCLLDARFKPFQASVFSEQSKTQERELMNKAESVQLDAVIEDFLGLAGSKILLKSTIKAIDWLVRRFKVHEYNTSYLVASFLPYHSTQIFLKVLAILPSQVTGTLKFLNPHIRARSNPRSDAITKSATQNTSFFNYLNSFVLRICERGYRNDALMSFWAATISQALSARLDKTRSGRRGIQDVSQEDELRNILPTVSQGLAVRVVPQMQIGCYMLITIIVSKVPLTESLYASFMEGIASGWSQESKSEALICMAVIAQRSPEVQLSMSVLNRLLNDESIVSDILGLNSNFQMNKLLTRLGCSIVQNFGSAKDRSRFAMLKDILVSNQLTSVEKEPLILDIVQYASNLDIQVTKDANGQYMQSLADLLREIFQRDAFSTFLKSTISDSKIDVNSIETNFKTTFSDALNESSTVERPKQIAGVAKQNLAMEFKRSIGLIPKDLSNVASFLSPNSTQTFDLACNAFIRASAPEDVSRLINLPSLKRDAAFEVPLFLTFLIRIWCGRYPISSRCSALDIAHETIVSHDQNFVDFQGLFPYLIFSLSDANGKIRQAAGRLCIALGGYYKDTNNEKNLKEPKVWAKRDLYGEKGPLALISWFSSYKDFSDILNDGIVSHIEECILDRQHVHILLRKILKPSTPVESSTSTGQISKLKRSIRTHLLLFLASHARTTPLENVQFELIRTLNQIEKIGEISRTNLLLPILQNFISVDETVAQNWYRVNDCASEDMDKEMFSIITPNSNNGLQLLQSLAESDKGQFRTSIRVSALRRIRQIWPFIKSERKAALASSWFKIACRPLRDEDGDSIEEERIRECSALLRTLDLSTDILSNLIAEIPNASLAQSGQENKRKADHLDDPLSEHNKDKTLFVRQISLIAELISLSRSSSHKILLSSLFYLLKELHEYKLRHGIELAFVEESLLRAIHENVTSFKSETLFNQPLTHVNYLIDSLSSSTSFQVQSQALLILASIAVVSPDLVLHAVMPIFTFMSQTLISNEDDFSIHVIDRTIRQVIPPLVDSLRRQKRDPVIGASDLMLTFVSTFEHMPSHRRMQLYLMLIETLGADEFLFALLVMLADKFPDSLDACRFAFDLSSHFDCKVQLLANLKFLKIVRDLLAPKPFLSFSLLGRKLADKSARESEACSLLMFMESILSRQELKSNIRKALQIEDFDSNSTLNLISSLLEVIIQLVHDMSKSMEGTTLCRNLLNLTLDLLTTTELVKSASQLLRSSDDELRFQALVTLKSRLIVENSNHEPTADALLDFLEDLFIQTKNLTSPKLVYISVSCINRIVEKYGKLRPDICEDAASTISGQCTLLGGNQKVQMVSLLCLSSIAEVLQERFISFVPQTLPTCITLLEDSLQKETRFDGLHSAALTYAATLLRTVPWAVDESNIDRLLRACYISAETSLEEEAVNDRLLLLEDLVKQVRADTILESLGRIWTAALSTGALAIGEFLTLLNGSVEKCSKLDTAENSQLISDVILKCFDLRRIGTEHALKDKNIEELEIKAINIAIKMIHKLNDKSFRPIFLNFLEWGFLDVSNHGRADTSRMTTFYRFCSVFFGSFKSIVTSYSSHIVGSLVETLDKIPFNERLWSEVSNTLHQCFEHDHDDFWQSPSHFEQICFPLLSQLDRPAVTSISQLLIRTIVELANAADSNDHHKDMNSILLELTRSPLTQTRLNVVRCQQALTGRLGEEWLTLLPEMLPFISELQEDDEEAVERETHNWITMIEAILGESLDDMLV